MDVRPDAERNSSAPNVVVLEKFVGDRESDLVEQNPVGETPWPHRWSWTCPPGGCPVRPALCGFPVRYRIRDSGQGESAPLIIRWSAASPPTDAAIRREA